MVKKQFAYLKTSTGFQFVTVYQAIKMKNRQIKNKDAQLLFYDTPNENIGELLFPKRTSKNGRSAHFSYYPSSKHAGVASETSMTHKIYELAIANMHKLKLFIFGEEIVLYIERAYPEYFVKTNYNSYYIDVYLILQGTEPKSYYYKWGGKIAIEICVSHKVDKSKANDLETMKIQVCEIKIYSNQYIPENISDENAFSYYTALVKNKIINEKNVGKLVNSVAPPKGSIWEKRYLELDNYEKEIKELQNITKENGARIKAQETEIEKKSAQIHGLIMRKQDIEKDLKKKEEEVRKAEKELSSMKKLAEENHILKNQVREFEETLKEEKKKGILKRFFRR